MKPLTIYVELQRLIAKGYLVKFRGRDGKTRYRPTRRGLEAFGNSQSIETGRSHDKRTALNVA